MSSTSVYGLTGCIGSGKSTAASILANIGFSIVDADELARKVVEPGSEGLKELTARYGNQIIDQGGSLNRSALGSILFSSPDDKKQIEAILHPKIRTLWLNELKKLSSNAQNKGIIYVVPLLFETKASYPEINKIITISATEEVCIQRIMSRNAATKEEAKRRLGTQLSNQEKCARSDYIISNNGSVDELQKKLARLADLLVKSAPSCP